jgi:biotin transport system substrate-specific component
MRVKDIAYIALFAAIMAALGLVPKIDLPFLPVPITAQMIGVMLAGSILGATRGALAILLFLALVAAGLPLLPGGRGGIGVFFGPTAGFLIGFPVAAYAIGWVVERRWPNLTFWHFFAINFFVGVGLVFLFGVPGVSLIAGTPLSTAALSSVVFLPGDAIKSALAASAAMAVKRGYPLIEPKYRSLQTV